jgi:hypothetical protein
MEFPKFLCIESIIGKIPAIWIAVLLGFGFVFASSQAVTGMLPRSALPKTKTPRNRTATLFPQTLQAWKRETRPQNRSKTTFLLGFLKILVDAKRAKDCCQMSIYNYLIFRRR